MDVQGRSTAKFSPRNYLKYIYRYGVYLIFLLMIVLFSFGNQNFLTASNFIMILQQASPMVIAVIGMTFVLILAGIDISIGQNMYLAAIVTGTVMQAISPLGLVDTLPGYLIMYSCALLSGAFVGLINGFMVSRARIVPFITTLATMSVARGIALIISNSKVIFVDALGFKHINLSVVGIPIVVIIAIVLLLVFNYILRWTPYGRYLMAIGNDPIGAQKIGINVKNKVLTAYIVCGTLGGLAGVLAAGQVGAIAVNFAFGNEFIVISSAVLGGTSLFGGKGSIIPGAIVGVMLVTTIVNGMIMLNADPYMYQIIR